MEKTYGQVAYEAFTSHNATAGIQFPEWNGLDTDTQEAWQSAADAVATTVTSAYNADNQKCVAA